MPQHGRALAESGSVDAGGLAVSGGQNHSISRQKSFVLMLCIFESSVYVLKHGFHRKVVYLKESFLFQLGSSE